MLTKAFKFRLRPNKTQRTELERILAACCDLYNAALQEKKDAYRNQNISLNCAKQQAELTELKQICPEFALIYSQVLQNVLKRLHLAFDAFFRRVKEAKLARAKGRKPKKPGFPRFRSKRRYDSFTFPQVTHKGAIRSGGVELTERGRLKVYGVPGGIKAIWHREMVGRPKTATFKREGKHWYVIFVCDEVPLEEREKTGRNCALDVGLEHFAVLDDNTDIPNPRFYRKAEKDIKLASRKVHKKNKRSKRRRKAVVRLAATHRHVSNQRRDFHHKEARKLVREYDRIAVEQLNIAGMARGFLSKSIHDAGWSQWIAILTSKAEGAGSEVIKFAAAGSSQECAACGGVVRKDLSVRVHCCPCGFVTRRDHNSALIGYQRAFGTSLGRSDQRGPSGGDCSDAVSHGTEDLRSPCLAP